MRLWIVGLVAAVLLLVSVPASARVHVWVGVPTISLGWGPFYNPAWPPYTPAYPPYTPAYPAPSYPYQGYPYQGYQQSYPTYSQPPVPMFTAPEPVWYYCEGVGYFPYVQTCPWAWRQVPTRPQ